MESGVKSSGRIRSAKRRAVWETRVPPGSREKPLERFPSRRPPSATSGGVSALSGSSSSGPLLPARAVPPTLRRPALSGTSHSARGSELVSHTPPDSHLVYSPTHSSNPFPASFFPILGDARASSTRARDPQGGVRREGPGGGRSYNPTDRRPPLASRLSVRGSSARGGASRPGLTRGPVGCNGLELGAPGSRWREHAPCALASGRARARADCGAGRRARATARSVRIGWHSGPSRGCDSQPAARPKREAEKGAVGAGRRPAPGELGEERDGCSSRRGGGGGGGAPFLFSDPRASGTQSRNWGTRRLWGPGIGSTMLLC
ncbi:translation initiation factor IF-2-like isoform X2 [Cervus canadensis]|uniref:translation initiation factor IF-2-like isoform X2 n=1 Tax=Cervus canadensis TaxID=1574408 RepID=UPI001CA31B1E|nr:translation initiation factor IF-2-like isoform X2 [Cervus canadensis]